MPFNRPDLKTLIDRVLADIESQLPGVDARLRRTVVNALGKTLAGAVHGLYGYLAYLSAQILPDTADAEHLARWASVWGISRKAASAAEGTITFTGADDTTIPAGTLLQRSDGAEYAVAADATIVAGQATAEVAAVIAGAAGNVSGGSLTLINPIAGVTAQATIGAQGLAGGADAESDDSLRERLLGRIQAPPHGGATFDYERWATEVPGVTRAWCFPLNRGDGTVDVYIVCDDQEGTIIPSVETVAAVQAYIDARRPVTADFLAVAPTAHQLNLTIAVAPATAAVRAAVEAELRDLLLREAEPGDGLNGGTILLSHLREAISLAAGETDHTLIAPVANVVPAAGHIVTLGAITWQ